MSTARSSGSPNLGTSTDSASESQAVAALYVIEREVGYTIQSNLLTMWIAASTYFTAVVGVLAVLLGSENSLSTGAKAALMCALPLPACALAGYHLYVFGIGLIRSRSIELLERELVRDATHAVRRDYADRRIGSKGETAWTDFRQASPVTTFASIVAFCVPYVSSVIVTYVCFERIDAIGELYGWVLLPGAIYTLMLAVIFLFGAKVLFQGPKLKEPAGR